MNKPARKKRTQPNPPSRRDRNVYPKGWDRKRVEALAKYYDSQSDDEAIAEAEAAYKDGSFAMMAIPWKLVPQVHRLLSRRAG